MHGLVHPEDAASVPYFSSAQQREAEMSQEGKIWVGSMLLSWAWKRGLLRQQSRGALSPFSSSFSSRVGLRDRGEHFHSAPDLRYTRYKTSHSPRSLTAGLRRALSSLR